MRRSSSAVLASRLLAEQSWLEHGFGTRLAPATQEGMASLKQIHSNLFLVAERPSGCAGEGDALLTARPGWAVSVRTADCLPILLADPVRRAVAAVHAGWRGTAARVAASALEGMRAHYGTRAEHVIAAIGPGIGACCYRVGAEVARLFGRTEAGCIDLAEANRCQLRDAGVREERIEVLAACTYCDAARFYSYRREGERAGRMISFIRVAEGGRTTRR
jgi:YfiH family protein